MPKKPRRRQIKRNRAGGLAAYKKKTRPKMTRLKKQSRAARAASPIRRRRKG